jgi:HlyD family secretion protein
MMAKALFVGVGVVATLAVIWQASQAGWVMPAPAPAGSRRPSDGPATVRHRPDSVIAEGRLVTYPGAEVVIAVERSGLIASLPVGEKSVVRKGDLIVELESAELRASRDEASARIDEAEAEIRFYEREVERRRVLIARGAASDVELETNQRGLDIARARRRAAQAARRRLDVLVDKSRITSPIDGVVIARFAHPGETVEASARIVTVVDLNRVRVEAEVDEIDIGAIALGAEASIFAEGFPGRTWRGRIEEIPDAVAGRHLRPEDTSRPIDTRVLLVKIALLEPTPLKLGQRVELEILRGRR